MLFLIIFLPICLITSINPVVSVLCLVGLSALLAVYWFLTGLTFISILYILVYVGAVAILFLFVIMTLDVRELELVETNWSKHLPIAIGVTVALLFTVITHVVGFYVPLEESVISIEQNHLQLIGQALYGYNSFGLIIMVLVLLSAMICPLHICLKKKIN